MRDPDYTLSDAPAPILPTHRACGTTITFKLLIAEDGIPALARWCQQCASMLLDVECDPPHDLLIADVPRDFIRQLLQADAADRQGRIQ